MSEPVNSKKDRELTWESRLAFLLPGSPIIGVAIIAACLIAQYLSFVWFFSLNAYTLAYLLALLIAYLVMIPRYLSSRNLLDRQPYELEKSLSSGRELEIQSLRLRHDDIRRSRWAGAFGILIFFIINEVAAVLEGTDLIEMFKRVHDGTAILPLTLFLGWIVGRSIYFSRVSDNGLPLPDSSAIDLLHLDNLYAVGRTGLSRALVRLVSVAIVGLMGLNTVFGLWLTVPVFAIGLVTGLVTLLRPARKVRNLIREVKRKELARLEPLVRQVRDDTLTGEISTQGRLTDLMAYQNRIESTAEWPFNSSTIIRFGLYLLIPVGSMIGGALVERIVNGLLG